MQFGIRWLAQTAILSTAIRAKTHSENQASLRKMIERDGLPGYFPGPTTRQWCDKRSNLDMFGSQSHPSQRNPGIHDWHRLLRAAHVVADMIPEEEAIPARLFGLMRQLGYQLRISIL